MTLIYGLFPVQADNSMEIQSNESSPSLETFLLKAIQM